MSRTLNLALARAPNAFVWNGTPEALSGLDLSTVSSASFAVKKPDGTETTWAATITNKTASTITLTHIFVNGVSVDTSGTWIVLPLLIVPAGVVGPEHPIALTVSGKYEI